MVYRSQYSGDQFNMLARGWELAFRGEWIPYGMPTSAGGTSPGGLLSLLVGLPLMVWADGRAATLLVWLMGVAGFLLLDRALGPALGPRGRLLFAVFYWLNPWRMHYTSILWNANYMFFFGAAHAWCAWRMRVDRRFWPSLAMVLVVGLGFQLHSAAVALAIAAVLLWWRGAVKVSWPGVAVGCLIVVASVVPWLAAAAARPDILPGGTGFPFRNLLLVQPFLRGVVYLLRYPSLALPGRVYDLDLDPGATADDAVSTALDALLTGLGWLSLLLPLAAYARFLPRWRTYVAGGAGEVAPRLWLRRYVFLTLAGSLVAFAMSPTSVMFWQGFPVFHAAVLPTVLLVQAALRSTRAPRARRLAFGWAAAALTAGLLVCGASPMLRPPGPLEGGSGRPRPDHVRRLAADHPMFHDLGLYERSGLVVVEEGGWMPDVFREGERWRSGGVEE